MLGQIFGHVHTFEGWVGSQGCCEEMNVLWLSYTVEQVDWPFHNFTEHRPYAVLEPHGEPVTCTPSISLISSSIIYRWTIYKKVYIHSKIDGGPQFSAHFHWNRWETGYLSNENVSALMHLLLPASNRNHAQQICLCNHQPRDLQPLKWKQTDRREVIK